MTKKKKSILISVISVAVVLAIVLPIVIINVVKKNKRLDWNGYMISGFSNFSAMGAAVIDTEGASSVAYAVDEVSPIGDKKDKHDAHLVGFKNDGSFEKIKFKDPNGKLHEQDIKLTHFDAYERFSLVSFSSNKEAKYVDIDNYAYRFWCNLEENHSDFILDNFDDMEGPSRSVFEFKDSYLFIIDNQSGKIYDIMHIFEKMGDAIYEQYGEKSFAVDIVNLNYPETGFAYESIIVWATLGSSGEQKANDMMIFEILFENDNIKLTQRMNCVQFNNFMKNNQYWLNIAAYNPLLFDRYGNVIYNDFNGYEEVILNYQKTDGTFGQIEVNGSTKKLTLSINGLFYYRDGVNTYYINKNGEMEEITLSEDELFEYESTSRKYLYSKDNVIYMAYSGGNPHKHGLMKMILSEEKDWDYTLEFVDFNDGKTPSYKADGTSVAANGGYLYELTSGVLMKYNIETGEHQEYNSKYQFKDLKYNKKLSQVTFKAVDKSTMTEVEGYFDENNEIVLGDFKDANRGLNRVYVVKPIN